ncbi:hypothetical protein NHX12_011081 [Muraenolepis orangiensis]|uniref:LRAT domain-containing protein n=1 Tax=Muraenolepis orangiensis TaxID=630683 RepID=A0A9Q0I6B7_9TELE|nr:hypothetical protein NHX12_011081 [Muraenolepis orangiensis]
MDPQPGDLIEITRGLFKHWAVYIGYKMVVHLVPNNPDDTRAFVKMEKLTDVVKGFQYKINNSLHGSNPPRETSLIVEKALEQVGTEHQYDLLKNNCEHFVTWLRYGIGESLQAKKGVVAAAVGSGVVGAVLLALFGASVSSSR